MSNILVRQLKDLLFHAILQIATVSNGGGGDNDYTTNKSSNLHTFQMKDFKFVKYRT